jgi:hypothetical protein
MIIGSAQVRPATFATLLLFLVASPADLRCQSPAEPVPAPVITLRSDVHLVLLDVSVTDAKGRPVTGLTKEDFHLFEDTTEQRIKHFEEHNGAVNVFLLDALDPLRDGEELRRQMIDFLRSVSPGTPFAIYQLDTSLHLVQPATTDRNALLAAVETMWDRAQFPQPLLTNRAALRRREILTKAIQQIAAYLGPLNGRKTLLWFTGGLAANLSLPDGNPAFPNDNELGKYLCGLTDILDDSRIAVTRFYSDGRQVNNLACTTGRSSKGTIAELLDRNSHYYTLSYTPTNTSSDGAFRTFLVQTDNASYHLDYRRGYTPQENVPAAPASHPQ